MRRLRRRSVLPILLVMRQILTASLFLALCGTASAQSWPSEAGVARDGFRGSIEAFDRFRLAENPRLRGEDERERVSGWVGAVRGWLETQYEKMGQNDSDSARHFNLRREWEGDLGRRR